MRHQLARIVIGALVVPNVCAAQSTFVNWESPHVHPLELTSDGTRLLAVNTADNRLEIFRLEEGPPVHETSIPVGLDPVSVRVRGKNEAWVVNHVSDSVSIVDLERGVVRATVRTLDEPTDVVFAGAPRRAFICCSQVNTVLVIAPDKPEQPGVPVPGSVKTRAGSRGTPRARGPMWPARGRAMSWSSTGSDSASPGRRR